MRRYSQATLAPQGKLGRLVEAPEVVLLDAGESFALPAGFPAEDDGWRYRYLFGAPGFSIGAVMAKVGWRYTGPAVRVAAQIDQGPVVACAWAVGIRYVDGSPGVNLAYAVAPPWEGRGIVRPSVAAAVVRLMDRAAAEDARWGRSLLACGRVNVQCAATNTRAAAVARSFGLKTDEHRSFVAADEAFCGFTGLLGDFVVICERVVAQRLACPPVMAKPLAEALPCAPEEAPPRRDRARRHAAG